VVNAVLSAPIELTDEHFVTDEVFAD